MNCTRSPPPPPPQDVLASVLAAWTQTSRPRSGKSGPSTQFPSTPPGSQDMSPAPRIPDTGPGTLHPPNPHALLELNPCTQMLPSTQPHGQPLPGVHPRASTLQEAPQPAAHSQPLGCSRTFPVSDTSWTPQLLRPQPHQTPPNLCHQTSTSGSLAARVSKAGPTCLQSQGT